jgi:hypothetical protein
LEEINEIKHTVETDHERCACLLAHFFAEKYKQKQFKGVIKMFLTFNPSQTLPSSFDKCAQILMNALGLSSIQYEKRNFCSNKECSLGFVDLNKTKERKCICAKRYYIRNKSFFLVKCQLLFAF